MIDCSFELNGKQMSALKCGGQSFPAFSGLGASIPSPIGMSDFGFGHHPARIAMTWHPGASKVAVERTMAKA